MLNDQQDIHVEIRNVKQDLFAFLPPSFPPSSFCLSLSFLQVGNFENYSYGDIVLRYFPAKNLDLSICYQQHGILMHGGKTKLFASKLSLHGNLLSVIYLFLHLGGRVNLRRTLPSDQQT